MNRRHLLIVALLVAPLLLWMGCEPDDPGTPLANQPPDTRIVVAPLQDSEYDHYVSPSSMFRVQWFGHDPDGYIKGYYLQVDSGAETWITGGDSLISFESSEIDPNDPSKTVPMPHTIKVTAVDNEDMRDPVPAERTFNAVNDVPVISEFSAGFADGDTVGPGIAFGIAATDANGSGILAQVSVDGSAVSDWDSRTQFQFSDTSDEAILGSVESEVYPIDISSLTAGNHTLSVAVKDLGGAVSPDSTLNIFIVDTLKPAITGVSAVYGSAQFYVDGSIFYAMNRTTTITVVGSAAEYAGNVSGYQYRYFSKQIGADDWGTPTDWSDWGAAVIVFEDEDELSMGEYLFELKCRDFTGAESEVSTYEMSLVSADFTAKNILVVDETKDGNGRPGSPDDQQCDDAYRTILDVDTTTWITSTGWGVTELDYVTHKVDDVSYVSPKDVFDKRIILWHADDKSVIMLADNERILTEYLSRGGRLILSGHDVMGAFSTADSTSFSGFVSRYLRIESGKRDITRNTTRGFIGMDADTTYGYPSLELDRDKISGRWAGLDRCWVLNPSRRTESVGTWVGSDSLSSYEGGGVCLRNFHPANDWKTITLGFPLYFMKVDQAQAFMAKAIEEIDR